MIHKPLAANIVIIFKALDLSNISTDKFKEQFNDIVPRFISLDQIIVSQYQTIPGEMIVTIPDKRLEVKISGQNNADLELLSRFAHHGLAAISGAEITAFGINYLSSLVAKTGDDVRAYMIDKFLNKELLASTKFKGDPLTLSPTLFFVNKGIRYQFTFSADAKEGKGIDAALNLHFAGSEFPDEKKLSEIITTEHEYFVKTVNDIFGLAE